jgi:hypothetical protein
MSYTNSKFIAELLNIPLIDLQKEYDELCELHKQSIKDGILMDESDLYLLQRIINKKERKRKEK